MVTQMVLVHSLTKEAYETILARLDPATASESAKRGRTFAYIDDPVVSIQLHETGSKKNDPSFSMRTVLDCTRRDPDTVFYGWLNDLYEAKFSVSTVKGFPAYDQSACDAVVYEQVIPVEDADKTYDKLLGSGKWLPEQLDRSLWDAYGIRNGYAWCAAKVDKEHFVLRVPCERSFLRRKCGVDPVKVLDPYTEEEILCWGKEKIYATNRKNRSPYTPEYVKAILTGAHVGMADTLIAFAANNHLSPIVKFWPGQKKWKCVYSSKKPKRVIFTLDATPESVGVKACLFHFSDYQTNCDVPAHFKRQMIENAWDCGECPGTCRRGVRFALDGQPYYKCIGGAFRFENLSAEDVPKLIELLALELNHNEG